MERLSSFQVFLRDKRAKMNTQYPFLSKKQIMSRLRDEWNRLRCLFTESKPKSKSRLSKSMPRITTTKRSVCPPKKAKASPTPLKNNKITKLRSQPHLLSGRNNEVTSGTILPGTEGMELAFNVANKRMRAVHGRKSLQTLDSGPKLSSSYCFDEFDDDNEDLFIEVEGRAVTKMRSYRDSKPDHEDVDQKPERKNDRRQSKKKAKMMHRSKSSSAASQVYQTAGGTLFKPYLSPACSKTLRRNSLTPTSMNLSKSSNGNFEFDHSDGRFKVLSRTTRAKMYKHNTPEAQFDLRSKPNLRMTPARLRRWPQPVNSKTVPNSCRGLTLKFDEATGTRRNNVNKISGNISKDLRTSYAHSMNDKLFEEDRGIDTADNPKDDDTSLDGDSDLRQFDNDFSEDDDVLLIRSDTDVGANGNLSPDSLNIDRKGRQDSFVKRTKNTNYATNNNVDLDFCITNDNSGTSLFSKTNVGTNLFTQTNSCNAYYDSYGGDQSLFRNKEGDIFSTNESNSARKHDVQQLDLRLPSAKTLLISKKKAKAINLDSVENCTARQCSKRYNFRRKRSLKYDTIKIDGDDVFVHETEKPKGKTCQQNTKIYPEKKDLNVISKTKSSKAKYQNESTAVTTKTVADEISCYLADDYGDLCDRNSDEWSFGRMVDGADDAEDSDLAKHTTTTPLQALTSPETRAPSDFVLGHENDPSPDTTVAELMSEVEVFKDDESEVSYHSEDTSTEPKAPPNRQQNNSNGFEERADNENDKPLESMFHDAKKEFKTPISRRLLKSATQRTPSNFHVMFDSSDFFM